MHEDTVKTILGEIAESLAAGTCNELREKADKDPFFFARTIMGNEPVFPESLDDALTGDWAKLFNFIFDIGKGIRLGIINSPRNSLKTTLLVALCAWLIAHDRNIRILYTTNVHKNAMNFSRSLQRHLAYNKLLIEAYGSFAPEDRKWDISEKEEEDASASWRQDYFTVSGRTKNVKEPTFTAGSVGKTEVGQHFDIILPDDCVDNDNTRTSDGMLSTIEWYRLIGALRDKNSLYGPGGCICNTGTRYADGDLHGWLLGETDDKNSPYKRYKSIVLRAMENPDCWDANSQQFINPKLNFPFILTKELLEDERANGPYYFNTQFQNECVGDDDAHFKASWFRIIKPYDIPDGLRYYVFTDYAFGLDGSNDRTAIWVVGLDWERKAYCVDFRVGRWGLEDKCKITVALAMQYSATKIALEKVNSNEGIKATILRLRDQYQAKLTLEEIGGRSEESKKLRILSLQSRFESGRIFFSERDPQDRIGIRSEYLSINKKGEPVGEIVKEFVRFPRATHDDIPDALSDIDKIDTSSGTYRFPGALRTPGGFDSFGRPIPQTRGPTVLNGRVLYSWGGTQNVRQAEAKKQTTADFYKNHAERIRRK